MSKNNPSGCKGCPKRYISPGAQAQGPCRDVCTDPPCGDPDMLTLLAPVVYDELGINLCRTINVSIPSGAAAGVSAQILQIVQGQTPGASTTVVQISGRPNCYLVTLTNLAVTFLLTFYDCAGRSIGTQTVTATWLPTNSTVADYDYLDEDTNPAFAELEIFAPYGVSRGPEDNGAPVIQYVGFTPENNTMHQGLNLMAIPKILGLDTASDTITIGLTLYIKSIYFSQYRIPHGGKAVVPKASIQPGEDTVCMDFVCGDLLEMDIKPLELGPPKCEARLKQACDSFCDTPCGCDPAPAIPKGNAASFGEDAPALSETDRSGFPD